MGHLNRTIGCYGEDICEKFLLSKGHRILHRNFRCKIGEIDIISKIEELNCICFTEVKSRYNTFYGRPCESISYKKISKIKKIAEYYILTNNLKNYYFRFDVMEIIFNINNNDFSLNLIENAF